MYVNTYTLLLPAEIIFALYRFGILCLTTMVVSITTPNEIPVMSTDMRFLKKLDGERYLQFRNESTMFAWTDVPMVEEIQLKDTVAITKPYEHTETA